MTAMSALHLTGHPQSPLMTTAYSPCEISASDAILASVAEGKRIRRGYHSGDVGKPQLDDHIRPSCSGHAKRASRGTAITTSS